jgi:hypothetical protein
MKFKVGDQVEKTSGDYIFSGQVVSVFRKRGGEERCVVESDEGLLHIFNEGNLNVVASVDNTGADT